MLLAAALVVVFVAVAIAMCGGGNVVTADRAAGMAQEAKRLLGVNA